MKFKDLKKKLKEHGFVLVRKRKHETYSNGHRQINLPTGGLPDGSRVLKAISLQIEGRGPFCGLQQKNKKQNTEVLGISEGGTHG